MPTKPLRLPALWMTASVLGGAALALFLGVFASVRPAAGALPATDAGPSVVDHVRFFAGLGDRSTGSDGADRAADMIRERFEAAGLQVGTQKFHQPVPVLDEAHVEVGGRRFPLYPWGPNMAYLPRTPDEGLTGPLVYVGKGSLAECNGRDLEGAIVLMDLTAGQEWFPVAMFGAKALIFLEDGPATRVEFEEKDTPTPVVFPRFYAPAETARSLVGLAEGTPKSATVVSRTRWENKTVENIYAIVPGASAELKDELAVVEASYDAGSHVLGLAPGADEATSIALLLALADHLSRHPPQRTVLLVATAGHNQGLAGTREFYWAFTANTRDLRRELRIVKKRRSHLNQLWKQAREPDPLALGDPEGQAVVWDFVVERAKDRADFLIREAQYRKALERRGGIRNGEPSGPPQEELEDPRPYRVLSWRKKASELDEEQRALAYSLLYQGLPDIQAERAELKERESNLRSSVALQRLARDYTPVLFLSLSLSSRSLPFGLAEWGATFPLRENVRRQMRALRLGPVLFSASQEAAERAGVVNPFVDTTRFGAVQSEMPAGSSRHCLACDIGALADCSAVSLATLNTRFSFWATPADTFSQVNTENLEILGRVFPAIIASVAAHPDLAGACRAGVEGFSSLEGRALFIRQGELFPDQPAPGTIVSAIQGSSIFRAMSYRDGSFFLHGVANKKVAFQKLILEPYGLDPETGLIAWTADKEQTGKDNYRIKIKGKTATTTLVMFHCLQTDVIGSFNPQRLDHLTKVNLLDSSTGAQPVRYWYSRVDGRDTMAISVFLEKGTRFKLILSDTLLRKELLLLNSSPERPDGKGFLIGSPPAIPLVPLRVARDLHALAGTRLQNLHERGIVNRYLEDLYGRASDDLAGAESMLAANRYDAFWERVVGAWAHLNVVYHEVEGTQRDVLAGVMFFIALFVPFAYCLERYLFCFRNVYKQITAFLLILVTTILVIRSLHPAFQLTYNPMVVIIAFFIVGLSFLVSWIIFVRFEHEMERSRQAHRGGVGNARDGVNKWQAFGAGFAIGASNLFRRRLRTALTCITLIILTFTVMSFTNVKTLHKTTRTRIADSNAYRGILLHHQIWRGLTPVALADLRARFAGEARLWPRAWVEPDHPSQRVLARVQAGNRAAALEGVLGLGEAPPDHVAQIVRHGRWFQGGDTRAVLLPFRIAEVLELDPTRDIGASVTLWDHTFTVVGFFDEGRLERLNDLDGNPLTPAYLELPPDEEITEVEVEAMEAGEEILPMTERFRNARSDSIVIVPYATSLSLGATPRSVSILPEPGRTAVGLADRLASWLAYPLFVGENGTWYQTAGRTLRYQGAANLLVPILIVVFICLNTMIGHVHERQREIAVYTSVGLAPTHVGFLFIVEALSLAVLSTVSGYILAQLTAKYLGNTALFAELTFNYSSLAGVACMVLVFTVVFLASLYPARIAARLSLPDVTRTWDLPDPVGDTLTLNLPFLLKEQEESGIMNYLTEHFLAHQDIAHGEFIVDDTQLLPDVPQTGSGRLPAPLCLTLRTYVWLAPFDFGIKQRVQLHCCPSEDNPGYLELAVLMMRVSGERTAWLRANKNFIKSLRKQMLFWRLLDEETKKRYSAATEVAED